MGCIESKRSESAGTIKVINGKKCLERPRKDEKLPSGVKVQYAQQFKKSVAEATGTDGVTITAELKAQAQFEQTNQVVPAKVVKKGQGQGRVKIGQEKYFEEVKRADVSQYSDEQEELPKKELLEREE